MADYICAACGTTFEDTAEHGRVMDEAYGVPLCPDCEAVEWLPLDEDSWEDLQDYDDEYRRYEREAGDYLDDPADDDVCIIEASVVSEADLIAAAQRDLEALATRIPF